MKFIRADSFFGVCSFQFPSAREKVDAAKVVALRQTEDAKPTKNRTRKMMRSLTQVM